MKAGLPCPQCGCRDSLVQDTRVWSSSGQSVYRRRHCTACSHRYTTFEQIANVPSVAGVDIPVFIGRWNKFSDLWKNMDALYQRLEEAVTPFER